MIEASSNEPQPVGTDSPFHVLVVDDERPVLELMQEFLEDAGLTVVALDSPAAALRKAKATKFDALILDVYMPEMPGMLFHAKLRHFDPNLARRTLFVSGHFSRKELQRDLEEQANLLLKPFDGAELVAAVRRLLPPTSRTVTS